MMRLLIDTHIFLWIFDSNGKLTKQQISVLESAETEIFVSHYTIMEIAIKLTIGKLPSSNLNMSDFFEQAAIKSINILPSKDEYAVTYLQVPLFENHRDPFDRFIIATAKTEGLSIMTNDEKFKLYEGFVHLW